jgi:prepilin-type N-terminal cleavage/methylation domain-containing protein
MKKNHTLLHRGFTLTELIVAITISVLIMGGIVKFLTILQQDILTSKNATAVHTSITDLGGIMRNLSKLYSSGSVIV